MKPFQYQRAGDVAAAVRVVANNPNAAYLAGGTNLVDLMKLEVQSPEVIVDVRELTSNRIELLDDGAVRIGASVTNTDLGSDPLIRERYPVLSEAVLAGASGQLRNLATVGGNLLQNTRCVYFQDPSTPCNKREPGTGCAALTGFQRQHAILGASEHCIATHPSDMAVAMVALDAVVRVQGLDGQRSIPLVELHRLPGDTPQKNTVLERGDLILSVDLPPVPAARSRYLKVRDRASFAFALCSTAAAVTMRDDVIDDIRLAFGGVAHKPWRAVQAEDALRGERATVDAFTAAVEAELAGARAMPGNQFKIPLLRNLVVSTLAELTGVTLP
ncbi:FAD binding domain-containing protein [Saccharopolyspora rectivirgula]|jgi:xanthine dehydrogenase YagS FAD-binding subunit|uniref:Molybdopterin dehydrogenase n=1 Tax=Saccharopolyspora rectivirgula TaxID=28042 RepID=A0A073B177_9PSEU|nr:xanthine dehydrogenase family protein subunit M [Saccharopolyspora rectivirgula]KEI45037.1 molybdopterin dehydrogenase [Saccharopolyspora rectivirgula]